MKLKKLCLFLLSFTALISVCGSAFASDYSYEPYYIEAYNIDINVTEDNILQVTEDLDVQFNESRHGIYRYIPISNSVERADGSKGTTHARVRNVKCSNKYSSSVENGNYVMKIGDEDKLVSGARHYSISYDYELGRDIFDGADEFYYNIIGNGWDTYIKNVKFRITMPKSFNKDLLGFSTGNYGSAGTNNIEYYVENNTIYGSLTKALYPYQAFTVRLELPDGYFYFNETANMIKLAAMIAIPAACLILVFFIWLKYGKDKKTVDVVEFYPPGGMSSADIAYWYKGVVTRQDLVPLLIELANEGYIVIHNNENEKNPLFQVIMK